MRGLRLSASCLIRNSFGQQASSTKRTCFCFAFLILHLYLHWRLGALTLISSKEPLTQRSTGPFPAALPPLAPNSIVDTAPPRSTLCAPPYLCVLPFFPALFLFCYFYCYMPTFALYCTLQNVTEHTVVSLLKSTALPISVMGHKTGCL